MSDDQGEDRLTRLIDGLVEQPAAGTPRPPRVASRVAPLVAAGIVLALVALTVGLVKANDHGRLHAQPAPAATGAKAAALAQWADFPATATRRPIVLTGPDVNDPASGYPTGADKLAFLSRNFVLATTLPSLPPTRHERPVITSADALAMLEGGRGGSSKSGQPLQITHVQLGTSLFSTDRGLRSFPAWAFSFAGVADPAEVVAIPAADRWPHADTESTDQLGLTATIAPDDHHVTLHFVGAPPGTGPCAAKYRADLTQSATAVLITIVGSTASSPSSTTACALIGYERSLTVRIEPAIGARVLITGKGAPVPGTTR